MFFLDMRPILWTHKETAITTENAYMPTSVIYKWHSALYKHHSDWTSKHSLGLITARCQSYIFDTWD